MASPARLLGLRLCGPDTGVGDFDDDAPTCPAVGVAVELDADGRCYDEPPPPLPPPPRASEPLDPDPDPDVRLDEGLVRLRERLGAVGPALMRLRDELARGARARGDRAFLELALADVTRALVYSRRSVRATVATLAELEREANALGERALEMLAGERPAR
jgi:hypothetical protein